MAARRHRTPPSRWWREAHRLHPENWTYKRQAWTLVTTPEGAPTDLIQGPNDVYEGNWLDDVAAAGPEHYYAPLDLDPPPDLTSALHGRARQSLMEARPSGSGVSGRGRRRCR